MDPSFGEQFQIAKPTERYSTLLDCLPPVLVLPEDRIVPLVSFLSAELVMAFNASGVVVPPWRQASSVLTKWKPLKSEDWTLSKIATTHHNNGSAKAVDATDKVYQQHQPEAFGKQGVSVGGTVAKRSAIPTAPSRQVKVQVYEPPRVYSGFGGSMSMMTG